MSNKTESRTVTVGKVTGVLTRGDDRWVVSNEDEVRLLAALQGDSSAREVLWAYAATLDAGAVKPKDVHRLNDRVQQIMSSPRPADPRGHRMIHDLHGATAFVTVCMNNNSLSRWLGYALAARLEPNLVRGPLPGPGLASWAVPTRQRHLTWDRDTHWISELSEEFWSRLSKHPDRWLRAEATASNPEAHPNVLAQRAAEHHMGRPTLEVLDLVASNPNTPRWALDRLGFGESWGRSRVSQRVAQNLAVPTHIAGALAKHDDCDMLGVLAWHPNLSPTALRRLARNEATKVRAGVASNPAAPTDVLKRLAKDSQSCVRSSLCDNASLPEHLLEALRSDSAHEVRARAVEATQRRSHAATEP